MASPLVCGPGHIYIGFPTGFSTLIGAITHPNTSTLTPQPPGTSSSLFTPGTGESQNPDVITLFGGSGGNADPVIGGGGGKIDNIQAPVPTQYFAAILLNSKVPVYLGTAEVTPEISIIPDYYHWSDDEGTEDDLYEGEYAIITAELNRFDAVVYEFMVGRCRQFGIGRAGVNFPGETGSSMIYEGSAYPLWIHFPMAAAKGRFALAGHPPGYRFFEAYLQGPDRTTPINTDPAKRICRWVARRYYDPASGAAATYDHNMIGLPLAS